MGGQNHLEDPLHRHDLPHVDVHLLHQEDLLAYLSKNIGQNIVPASPCLATAVRVTAVRIQSVVDLATIQAGPGDVGPVLGVGGEEAGDGSDDVGVCAGVCPVCWVACGEVVRVELCTQVTFASQLLYMQNMGY